MKQCLQCGLTRGDDVSVCRCGSTLTKISGVPHSATQSATPDALSSMVTRVESPEAHRIMTRYRDAYRVGRVIVTVGNVVKNIGFVAGAIIVLVASSILAGVFGMAGLVMGIVVGGLIGLLLYVVGVIIAAQGQVLKATLDSAVNSSPFLSNEHKAESMSL